MRRTVRFTKLVGGWGFTWGELEFFAYHNVAGFAGRAWELMVSVPDGGFRTVEDMLATRAECVDAAADKYEALKARYGT